jgi:hypothetical protein
VTLAIVAVKDTLDRRAILDLQVAKAISATLVRKVTLDTLAAKVILDQKDTPDQKVMQVVRVIPVHAVS